MNPIQQYGCPSRHGSLVFHRIERTERFRREQLYQELIFTFPFGLFFWAVFFWAFADEYRIFARPVRD
jgi:hypothetical protein